MTTTYVPPTLGSMISVRRRGVMERDGEAYCRECLGNPGTLSYLYGALILEGTISEIDKLLKKHDVTHNVTLVDRDNCQMGM